MNDGTVSVHIRHMIGSHDCRDCREESPESDNDEKRRGPVVPAGFPGEEA